MKRLETRIPVSEGRACVLRKEKAGLHLLGPKRRVGGWIPGSSERNG